MNRNYIFTDITSALPALLSELAGAPVVGSRAGRTRELTHVGITLENPLQREVLVPERKCNIAAQIAETAWVLAGRNDVEWLSHYLPRAADFSDDGKVWRSGYGPRLRDWHGVDQLAEVVTHLRNNPETRRAVAVLWDPVTDPQPGKDIACNNWLSFLIRDGALDLHVAVRSNDAMWGWSGINVFEWSALQEIVAGLVGVSVGQLHFSVTSFHLYERHWEKADRIVLESARTQRVNVDPSPRFDPNEIKRQELGDFDKLLTYWFQIEYDIRTGSPLVREYIAAFPEPMLRSWLRVLDWWWNGKVASPNHLDYAALGAAARMGVSPPWVAANVPEKPVYSPFLAHAIALHNEKHAAYGDSWKRRGEMLGIMANIARKIDRLGGSDTSDETSADTALDLMVYLAKYRTWLRDQRDFQGKPAPVHGTTSDTPDAGNELLEMGNWFQHGPFGQIVELERDLRTNFDRLEKKVLSGDPQRHLLVDDMLRDAYLLARSRYDEVDLYPGADHE
jgi:thymidylate synthase